ncbi:MAG: hypothetical protein ACT6FF_04490 [Methanosarcinaceae archaeon]
MKVRIEIFEDDGTEKASAQFNGKQWKEYVTNFIHLIDDTKSPSTVPSSEIPTQKSAPQVVQSPIQQQVSPYSQLQYYPYSPIQQPVFYYPQSVQYHPNTQSINPQPLQQAVSPIDQPPSPQQYAAQPVAPLHQAVSPIDQPPSPQQYAAQPVAPLQQAVSPIDQPPSPQQYAVQPVAPLQQAVSPINQSPSPQQYAAQPVAPLQSQAQTRQPNISLRDKINDTTLTISERLELFLKFEYPHVWFKSQEIQGHYERVYGFIKLSTVSTYLSRMYRKNLLQRRGNRTQREYMYICDELDISRGITVSEANGIMQ